MATSQRTLPKNEETKVLGIYRRGNRYVHGYRVEAVGPTEAPETPVATGSSGSRPRASAEGAVEGDITPEGTTRSGPGLGPAPSAIRTFLR